MQVTGWQYKDHPSLNCSRKMKIQSPEQTLTYINGFSVTEFFNLQLLTMGARSFLLGRKGRDCPVHCRRFNISGLYPLDAHSYQAPNCEKQVFPDIVKCPLRVGGQNHLHLRTTSLKSTFQTERYIHCWVLKSILWVPTSMFLMKSS